MELKNIVFKKIRDFFSLVPEKLSIDVGTPCTEVNANHRYTVRFLPSVRQTIIAAGKSQTLVELIDDSFSCFVEPYHFEFRVRKFDGFEIEFLYGFEQSNIPQVQYKKMFSAEEFREAKPTSISFEPKLEAKF